MKLIPPEIPSHAPTGEKKLFKKFSFDRRFNDWVAIHSIDIIKHLSNVAGEIDFVLINPRHGILCIEVKSHKRIVCKNKQWYFGDSETPKQSPFDQVKNSSFSLRKYVTTKDNEFENIPWWHIVIFPNCKFIYDSPAWESWMVIDKDGCKNLYEALDRSFRKAKNHIVDKSKSTGEFNLNNYDLNKLLNILVPEFETDSIAETIGVKKEAELKKYTEEQYEALDNMQENRRVFFKGSAGTGKTFLAIESAKRSVDQGKKVLLLCYNKGLCDWIRKEVGQEPRIQIYNIDRLLIKLCDDTCILENSKDLDTNFWNITLPNKALESIGLKKIIDKYDKVILDEAQDLLKPTYLEIIDQVLKKGLKSGNWAIFGDFINQSIFSSYSNNKYFITLDQFEQYLDNRFANYTLTKNCRNIQQVGDYYENIVKLDPGYNSYLRNNIYGAIGAEVIQTSSLADKINLTLQIIKKIISDTEMANVAILSIYDDEYLVKADDKLRGLDTDINTSIVQYLNKGGIYLGTVQSFKGLEADSVVLRSSNILKHEDLNLFYVGCSRARDNLYVLK